ERRPDACGLRLGLAATADDAESPCLALRKMPRRDAARGTGPEPAKVVRLDDGNELGAHRVEETDDEGRPVTPCRIELAACEAESEVGRRHVGERARGQPQPSARCDLDLAVRHPPKPLL